MLPEDPNVENFAYDCNRYPELCQNTECWRKWSPYSAAGKKKIKWVYDDVYIPRRRWAMSRLGSPPSGTQRDEVPMNKVRLFESQLPCESCYAYTPAVHHRRMLC